MTTATRIITYTPADEYATKIARSLRDGYLHPAAGRRLFALAEQSRQTSGGPGSHPCANGEIVPGPVAPHGGHWEVSRMGKQCYWFRALIWSGKTLKDFGIDD